MMMEIQLVMKQLVSSYTPFISRFIEKEDYLINGMPITRPGTMPGGYFKGRTRKQVFQLAFNMLWAIMISNWVLTIALIR